MIARINCVPDKIDCATNSEVRAALKIAALSRSARPLNRTKLPALAAFAVMVLPTAAMAFEPLFQSGGSNAFGDDRLAYQNGVVYDDDLVPGRGLNQEFLVGDSNEVERNASGLSGSAAIPPNSRQLIGPDGRLLPDAGK